MAGGLFAMCTRDAIQRGMQSFSAKPLPATLAPVAGEAPKATDRVKVHYHGTLADGTVYASSRVR